MAWEIKYSDTALRELKKLDKAVAKAVLDYMDTKIAVLEDPMTAGKALTGTLATLWRYRERDIRLICYVDKGEVTVLVLRAGHRSKVYEAEKKIAGKAASEVEAIQKAQAQKKKKTGQEAAHGRTDNSD